MMNGKVVPEPEILKNKHYATECLCSTLTAKLLFLTEGARQNASSGLTVAMQILFMFHEWCRSSLADARLCAEGMLPTRIDGGVEHRTKGRGDDVCCKWTVWPLRCQ
jgi:hypothetical protein